MTQDGPPAVSSGRQGHPAGEWRQGYEAALREVERRAGRLEHGQAAVLLGVLGELRAGLAEGHVPESPADDAHGIPREDIEREYTA
jgi:hypothetical protein